MSDIQWQLLSIFSDVPSAHAVAARLAAEGLTVRIVSDAVVLGQAVPGRLMTDRLQLRRAQLILAENTFSDRELLFLSTGEQGDEPGCAVADSDPASAASRSSLPVE